MLENEDRHQSRYDMAGAQRDVLQVCPAPKAKRRRLGTPAFLEVDLTGTQLAATTAMVSAFPKSQASSITLAKATTAQAVTPQQLF